MTGTAERAVGGRARYALVLALLIASLPLVYFVCLFLGSVSVSAGDVIGVWTGSASWADTYIVTQLRMPRALCAAIVGGGLAMAGMAMQAMFRNPMASPSVLGISSGASFGACLTLGFGFGGVLGCYSTSVMAFLMCFLTLVMVYMLAYTRNGVPAVLLLLSGVAVGTFFSGASSLLQYLVDDKDALANIVYWTMGSFGKCDWSSVWMSLVTVGAGVGIIAYFSKELNLISMGEEQARSLGADVRKVRIAVLAGTALCVGGSVAVSGIIAFVGLIVPHVCRALAGPDHVRLWPVVVVAGALFLMLMDLVCRTAMAPSTLPIGVLTSMIGAPFFVYIMRKRRSELWG